MGCGSSKPRGAPIVPQVVVAPPPASDWYVGEKHHGSMDVGTTMPPPPLEEEPAAENLEVNPADFLAPGVSIVHAGEMWKLNHGASAHQTNEWLRRKMWLTDSGSLFYFSQQHRRPVGRAIATLKVRVTDDHVAGRFIFELKQACGDDGNSIAVSRTMLAVENEAERDAWVHHLRKVCEQAQEQGRTGSLDPLEPVVGKLNTDRRRLSTQSVQIAPTEKTMSDAHSRQTGHTETLSPQISQLLSGESSGTVGVIKSSKTLRLSLNARLIEHCRSMSGSGFVMSDSGQRPSYGPSAFVEQGVRLSLAEQGTNAVPVIRRDSQARFAAKGNSFIVLDWDDTLFPTTFIRQDCGLDWRRSIVDQVKPGRSLDELMRALDKLASNVEAFVDLCCAHGHVVIVTLAKRPWVNTSIANFIPRLGVLLQRHNLEVVYAREKVSEEMKADYAKSDFKASDQEVAFWMRAKAAAMLEQLEKYHGTRITWKNLLSFGDGEFERIAMITNAERWLNQERVGAHVIEQGLTSELISKDGHRKRLRTKTVKMLDEPALEEVIAQLELFRTWLPHLVRRDRGIDVVIEDSEDDNRLRELDKDVTGSRRPKLTWRRLAGIDP